MQNIKPSRLALWPLALCAGFVLLWGFILIRKYVYFGYDDWDLAYFNQAMWNLIHGNAYVSVLDLVFWANHSNLIALLCLPIYALAQHPLTLVFLKVLSFAGAGYFLYLIGRERAGEGVSILIVLLFFFYPPNIFAILYEFDFESLFPVLGTALFYFFIRERFFAFFITMLMAILVKENIPLILMAFGVYAAFSQRENKWRWVLTPLLGGTLSFYFLTYIFIPSFHEGGGHPYVGYYKAFGDSPFEVIINIILRPWQIVPYLWTPPNRSLILELFGPLTFLPFLSPHVLFLASPVLLQHLLSYAPTEHTIYYQYASSFSPFIFIATIYSLAALKRYMRPSFFHFLLTLLVLSTSLSFAAHAGSFARRNDTKKDHLHLFRWDLVRTVPVDAGAMASFDYLAELSSRKKLYAFHKVYNDDFQRPDHRFTAPEDLSYVLVDFHDGWLVNDFYRSPQVVPRRIHGFFLAGPWGVKKAAENIVLFEKGAGPALVNVAHRPDGVESAAPIVNVDERFALIGVGGLPERVSGNSLVPLTFHWKSYRDITDYYSMRLILRNADLAGFERERSPGYFVYPTSVWQTDDRIEERYWLYVPDLPPGRYVLETVFLNNTQRNTALLSWKNSNGSVETKKRYALTELIIDEH